MFGVTLALKEAIYHCRHSPPANWPPKAYVLIGMFVTTVCNVFRL